MKITTNHILWLKIAIHSLNAVFFADLLFLTFSYKFGADPVDGITHYTGIAALNTLFITLTISPLAHFFKQGALLQCRRVLGLYCFFWATLHLFTYFALNLRFNFSLLGEEIINRPYLTLGAICWLILCALAITSNRLIQRRMGKKWQHLHNMVYVALILAPIHFYWSAKSELIEPYIYLFYAFILLNFRWKKIRKMVFVSTNKTTH